jgi:hypothetical protein
LVLIAVMVKLWSFKSSGILRLVEWWIVNDVLEQRARFVYGVCQFKIQRFVTKIFIVVVVVVNVFSVIILGVLYTNFIVTISGQVFLQYFVWWGTRWRSYVLIGIFDWLNPSGRTMVLESSQSLRETSTLVVKEAGE